MLIRREGGDAGWGALLEGARMTNGWEWKAGAIFGRRSGTKWSGERHNLA